MSEQPNTGEQETGQTIMPPQDSSPKPVKTPRGTVAQLADRAAKLEAELAATKKALKSKQHARAAKEQAQTRKERTHALILAGLHFMYLLMDQAANTAPEKRTDFRKQILRSFDATLTKENQGKNITPKLEANTLKEYQLFEALVDRAIKGTFK